MIGPRSMDSRTSLAELQQHPISRLPAERRVSAGPIYAASLNSSRNKQRLDLKPHPLASTKLQNPSFSRRIDKNAVRQSFRNLVEFFKKGNNKLNIDRLRRRSRDISPQPHRHPETEVAEPNPESTSQTSSPISGSLLYLSRPDVLPFSSPILPVWTTCDVTLHTHEIVLSWLTSHGNPDKQSISLVHCTDVRSLSTNDLDPDERALLPRHDDASELRLFEVIFEGRSREVFGAHSVIERARWVSALWEVVLPSQGVPVVVEKPEGLLPPNLSYDAPLPSRVSVASTERSLPSVPLEDPPGLPDPMEIPNHLQPEIQAEASTPTSVQAPRRQSIADLNQRFMVKERLSQIERVASPATPLETLSSRIGSHLSLSPEDNITQSPVLNHHRLHLQATPSEVENDIVQSYADIQTPSPLPPSMKCSSDNSLRLQVVLDLLRDHTTKQFDQSTNIGDQLLVLQRDVQSFVTRTDQPDLAEIHTTVSSIEEKTDNTSAAVRSLLAKLEEVYEKVKMSHASDNVSGPQDVSGIHRALDTIHALLGANLPAIVARLEEIRQPEVPAVVSMHNEAPSSNSPRNKPAPSEYSILKELLAASSPNAQVDELLALVKDERSRQDSQAREQADSHRYFKELNSWLETFVKDGTNQIQGVSMTLASLCRDLGCGASDPTQNGAGLAADIRQLTHVVEANQERNNELQDAVHQLSATVQGGGLDSKTLTELLEIQRGQHEASMRALAGELAKEIQGERLSFVDAMKEATAIHIHGHVEEFKKELKNVVQTMTCEVTRLSQEKQRLENEIAELFAFYSKQTKVAMPPSAHPQSTQYSIPHHYRNPRQPLPNAQMQQAPY